MNRVTASRFWSTPTAWSPACCTGPPHPNDAFLATLETTPGQIVGLFIQLSFRCYLQFALKCYLPKVASVGD